MSPRPRKPRAYCCHAKGGVYKPAGVPLRGLERVELTRDELEALKLCDADGLNQEAAGRSMGVSRGTVQRILLSARRKVAHALSECAALVLEETVCKEEKSE